MNLCNSTEKPTNLQPLWVEENIKKSNKIVEQYKKQN